METKVYSFAKGVWKALQGAAITALSITAALVILSYPDLANTTVLDLLNQQLYPILGTTTVAGLLTLVVNYLKVTYSK